jgi:hypothetical protein
MSLNLNHDYEEKLRSLKPFTINENEIRPVEVSGPPGQRSIRPAGALKAITIPSQTIPPLNTDIQFSTLPIFNASKYPGLAAIDTTKLPENFNWRHNGDPEKRRNLSKPGNQMLCGSCWAISTAGIVADNHVIAGTVTWTPNLSTTWCLSCFPQYKCQGGNPAKLFQDISEHGIATNHCVDYSWCSENETCNGAATKHFDPNTDLSSLVPDCGCYDSSEKHYLYYVDPPVSLSIGRGGMTTDNFFTTVKKHIYKYGPVQGGFLVFKNFRSGAFTKINGGVYLETGIYDENVLKFDDKQVQAENYIGSHAVAIIGWGVEKDVIVDEKGSKKDVPYWYCRNSWTEKWGDGGYFKMAMYPHNKIVQFDTMVTLATPQGEKLSGAMVSIQASKPPELVTLKQISEKFLKLKREKSDSYYKTESKNKGKFTPVNMKINIDIKSITMYTAITLTILLVIYVMYKYLPKLLNSLKSGKRRNKVQYVGRSGSYI